MQVLLLEPFHGGSHRRFAEQWRERTALDELEIVALAPRHWKWRMRSSAWELAHRLADREPPDALVATDYVDLPALHGFLPAAWARTPSLYYLHENQLTYPLREESSPDHQYGWTNVLGCLRAELCVFNSRYHLDDFRAAALELCRRLPRPNPRAELEAALERAVAVGPGIDLEEVPLGAGPPASEPLHLVFNHRQEHDKDPERFLRLARELARRGAAFRVTLLGGRYERRPSGCDELLDGLRCGGYVAHDGELAHRADYAAALGRADVVVSTARHEFYGMAVLEALAAGCAPLLPDALSYPELLEGAPDPFRYGGDAEALERLERWARDPAPLRAGRRAWREHVERHDARHAAARMDALVEGVVERSRRRDRSGPPDRALPCHP